MPRGYQTIGRGRSRVDHDGVCGACVCVRRTGASRERHMHCVCHAHDVCVCLGSVVSQAVIPLGMRGVARWGLPRT